MNYVAGFEKGSIVTGSVTAVDAKFATITLAEGVDGVLRASEISRDKVEDARSVLQEGAEIEVKIVSVDRKNRVLSLSVKAIEFDGERTAIHDHKKQDAAEVSHGTIGDLIKAEMDKS
jgi:small subunit ribosomal protein S1